MRSSIAARQAKLKGTGTLQGARNQRKASLYRGLSAGPIPSKIELPEETGLLLIGRYIKSFNSSAVVDKLCFDLGIFRFDYECLSHIV